MVRNLLASDYEIWLRTMTGRKPKVNRFDPGPLEHKALTRDAFRKVLARAREKNRANGFHLFGIFSRSGKCFYGTLDIFYLNAELNWVNLGLEISNNHWHKGIASEAAKLGLEIAFSGMQVHRLEVGCDPENVASHKVIKKLGLNFEGMRKNFFPNNESDLLVYAISKPEYDARQG